MASDRAESPGGHFSLIPPSHWLFALTLSLLAGQAVATLPFELPWHLAFLAAVPLAFLFSPSRRALAFLSIAGSLLFAVGYVRHRTLVVPTFPSNHLRSVMNEGVRYYLEGTLIQEPEKLPNRNRWIIRSERLWHPTGAEEIGGDFLLSIRKVYREWRFGDRVR